MKQTAVQWLVEYIHSAEYQMAFGINYISPVVADKALEMEKEQICLAWDEGKVEGMCLAGNSEYNHLLGFEYYGEEYETQTN